jgi:hypothetical protein
MIFAAFIRIRLKRKHDGSTALLYLVTANFIACSAYLAVDVTASQSIASLGVVFASNVLYTCVDFISQGILVTGEFSYISVHTTDASGFPFSIKIYRCWIIWRQPWVMVVPILLTLAFLGANLPNLNCNLNILKLMYL